MRGKATTDAAITAAGQEKTIAISASSRSLPMGPVLPRRINNINPMTVGGRTRGSINTPSNISFPFQAEKATNLANARPATIAMIVATPAVFIEIHKGIKSIVIINFLPIVYFIIIFHLSIYQD
jgi:hypothetical protein